MHPVTPISAQQQLARRAHAFAVLTASDEGQRRGLNVNPRCAELIAAIVAAVMNFLAIRTRRFPRLASCLPQRFATDFLPRSTVRALRRTSVEAFVAQWHSAPAAGKGQVLLSRFEIFVPARTPFARFKALVPARGLSIRRTTAQALAAGFPDVSSWTEAIIAHRDQIAEAARLRPSPKPKSLRKSGAERFRIALASVARSVAEEVARAEKVPLEYLTDLELEADVSISEFVGKRMGVFPRILVRFAAGTLPFALEAEMLAQARKRVTARATRLARRPVAPPAVMRPPTVEESQEINRRIDALLELVRARETRDDVSARFARAHANLLEECRRTILRGIAA